MERTLRKQHQLLLLLTENMKEMETELRAHSIVLEALAEGVIGPEEIGESLAWARSSTAMLQFVKTKYLIPQKLCEPVMPAKSISSAHLIFPKTETLMH